MAAESKLESQIKEAVIAHGGVSYKWVSPATRGVPDRLCVFRSIGTVFIEVKAPTGTLSKAQDRIIAELRAHGARVWVIDHIEQFPILYQSELTGAKA